MFLLVALRLQSLKLWISCGRWDRQRGLRVFHPFLDLLGPKHLMSSDLRGAPSVLGGSRHFRKCKPLHYPSTKKFPSQRWKLKAPSLLNFSKKLHSSGRVDIRLFIWQNMVSFQTGNRKGQYSHSDQVSWSMSSQEPEMSAVSVIKMSRVIISRSLITWVRKTRVHIQV